MVMPTERLMQLTNFGDGSQLLVNPCLVLCISAERSTGGAVVSSNVGDKDLRGLHVRESVEDVATEFERAMWAREYGRRP